MCIYIYIYIDPEHIQKLWPKPSMLIMTNGIKCQDSLKGLC